jgi:hypothetical protein
MERLPRRGVPPKVKPGVNFLLSQNGASSGVEALMIQLALISFAFGALLAGRYRFLILSVATFFGLLGVALYAYTAHLAPMKGLLAGLLFAICLQGGYLTGALFFELCLPLVKAPAHAKAQVHANSQRR